MVVKQYVIYPYAIKFQLETYANSLKHPYFAEQLRSIFDESRSEAPTIIFLAVQWFSPNYANWPSPAGTVKLITQWNLTLDKTSICLTTHYFLLIHEIDIYFYLQIDIVERVDKYGGQRPVGFGPKG